MLLRNNDVIGIRARLVHLLDLVNILSPMLEDGATGELNHLFQLLPRRFNTWGQVEHFTLKENPKGIAYSYLFSIFLYMNIYLRTYLLCY